MRDHVDINAVRALITHEELWRRTAFSNRGPHAISVTDSDLLFHVVPVQEKKFRSPLARRKTLTGLMLFPHNGIFEVHVVLSPFPTRFLMFIRKGLRSRGPCKDYQCQTMSCDASSSCGETPSSHWPPWLGQRNCGFDFESPPKINLNFRMI